MAFERLLLLTTAILASAQIAMAGNVTVLDGETVTVDGNQFHLHGIDAPALDEVCWTSSGAEWACGRKAKEQLVGASSIGDLSCEPAEPSFVLCRVAGLDVAALLVKEGLAKAAGDYKEIEDQARAAKVGLWE